MLRPCAYPLLLAFALIAALASGCGTAPDKDPGLVAAPAAPGGSAPRFEAVYGDQDAVHAETGMRFPELVGPWERRRQDTYDLEGRNMSATYLDAEGLMVTVYVFPALASLRDDFLGAAEAISLHCQQFENVAMLAVPSPVDGLTSGPELAADCAMDTNFQGPTNILLRQFQHGPWFLKVRATWRREIGDGLERVDALLDAMTWPSFGVAI
jgi:hypothetical protein